ncbi:MAG: D-ribose pyranase [Clostridium sp.]|jgi:D-ribose pyranase|nr:D-ribose pyranase [Clostridium sp.]
MKRGILLNSEISYVISKLGHTDTLTIGDCGLPVPEGVQRIDLAVVKGLPEFMPVLRAVLDEQEIEKVILAEEIKVANPELLGDILKLLEKTGEKENKDIEIEYVPHEDLKKKTKVSKAVVRTGEYRSYANIILVSSVTF